MIWFNWWLIKIFKQFIDKKTLMKKTVQPTLGAQMAPFFMRGCLRTSFAKGLCSMSLTSSSCTKSASVGQSVRSSAGGGLRGIWNRARMGCSSDRGGSPWASSMAVMPSDQTSQRASYQESSCCSQAMTCRKQIEIINNLWNITQYNEKHTRTQYWHTVLSINRPGWLCYIQ